MNVKKMFDEEMNSFFNMPQMKLGPWTSESMRRDPKHLGFVLARYKFVAKMLEGRQRVLEVGGCVWSTCSCSSCWQTACN